MSQKETAAETSSTETSSMPTTEGNAAPASTTPVDGAEPTPTEPTTSAPTQTDSTTPTPHQSSVSRGVIGAVLLGAIVVAGLLYWYAGSTAEDETATAIDFGTNSTPAAAVADEDVPEVVATVDGVDISRADFLETVQQIENSIATQGQDPSNPSIAAQIQDQALTQLVNNELLAQAATEVGVTVEEAAVATELEGIIAGFASEAEFEAELDNAGLTRAELEENISLDIAINRYFETLDAVTAAGTATREEALAAYDNVVAQSNGAELPPFAEVEAQILAQLNQQYRQTAIADVIADLRADASVELFI